MTSAKLAQTENSKDNKTTPKEISAKKRIRNTHTKEIIFALCGYLGSNIKSVGDAIAFIMENDYGYEVVRDNLKLSSFITKNKDNINMDIKGSPEYIRLKKLIEGGNKMREEFGQEILTKLAIQKIGTMRLEKANTPTQSGTNKRKLKFEPQRICYIIESIKNPSELSILKEVYRNLIYTIGVFSPLKIRVQNLKHKEISDIEIAKLIDQDNHEDSPHGQDVSDVFKNSDYFLRIDSSSKTHVRERIGRFIHLVFGTEIITPTKDETAMYFAASASANSACLSRQVGASVTDKLGNIISVGWNDVPRYNGNLYKHDSLSDLNGKGDHRCLNHHNGQCMNDEYKERISKNLFDDLLNIGCIDPEKEKEALETIRKSRLRGLIEFSRAIHAEMHAIVIGSQQSGSQMVGGKLFCTTYPCHNCARHIVLAGINEVYFIEPYVRSLATTLHSDSISEDESDSNKVKILLYDGVAPSRYMQLFKMHDYKRKDSEGKLIRKKLKEAAPKYTETLEALATLESTATKNIKDLNLKI